MKKNNTLFCILLGLFAVNHSALANTYFPMKLVNNTKIASDENVYVFIKAEKGGHACVMKIEQTHDKDDGHGDCVPVTENMDLTTFNYPLSALPVVSHAASEQADTDARMMYLPKVNSGRIYFSVGTPMQFFVNNDNSEKLTIPDPDGFRMRDPNYYTLYDKIEFTYNDFGTWLNPTAVDFFSLPIRIEQPSSSSSTTFAGFSDSRATVLEKVNEVMNIAKNSLPKTYSKWKQLFLNYDGAFADQSSGSTLLRVMAPGKAMEAIPYVHAAANEPFDLNYLNDESLGLKYIDAVWDYYKENKVLVDASELKGNPAAPKELKHYIFTGTVNAQDEFIFTNQDGYTVTFKKPDSISFFAGAIGAFNAANNTPKAIIVRELTSAFDVGLLPTADGDMLSHDYFEHNKSKYYTLNTYLNAGGTGPWYDLYSKALHSFGAAQPIYTFAYDDALGQDGTLHDSNVDNIGIATITIGDMTGTHIPKPSVDHEKYTINVTIGENSAHEHYSLKVLDKTILPGAATTFTDVSAPLAVEFNGKHYEIDFKHPMVRPYNQQSKAVNVDRVGDNRINIVFPGKPN